jgi:DNA-binding NtrC family response regulator
VERPARLYHLLGAVAELRGDAARAEAERLRAARIVDELAARIAPDRRPLFYARRRRRAVLDAAGRALLEVRRTAAAPAPSPAREEPVPLVGRSAGIARVNGLIARVGPSAATVLVRGESGTGKELVAHALHDRSERAAGPFVELNCSALPEHLVESELFGHERGSFSDAREQKRGLVELADGGTLFLDEIGDLAAGAQAKLLKFVETKEFRRVGGTKQLKVDCRIVAATHRDLSDGQRFRPDLYFRMSGMTVMLPPLREREDDVLLLARHFLALLAVEYRKPLTGFTREAEVLLARHPWTGNVRELRAAVSFAAAMADRPLIGADLLSQLRGKSEVELEPKTQLQLRPLDLIESEYCKQALAICGGNRGLAAEKLQISRHTLARKVGEGDDT